MNRPLQFGMWASTIGYVLLSFLAVTCYLCSQLMIDLRTIDPNSEQAFVSAGHLLYVVENLWVVGLLCLVIISLNSFHLSHKVTGPLYRLTRVLKAMKKGQIPETIRLRKRDFLRPEIELINEVIDGLRANFAELTESQKALREELRECSRIAADTVNEQLGARLEGLVERADEFEAQLSGFFHSAPSENAAEIEHVRE